MATATVNVDTRTIHTISIALTDDVLAKVDLTDDVEILITTRGGMAKRVKLSYGDLQRIMDGYR